MATVKTSGFNDLLDGLKEFGENIDEIADEMLDAGSEVAVEEWKNGIKQERHRIVNPRGKGYIEKTGYIDTGAMEKAVKSSKKKGKTIAEIYPRGKDKKGVRNAEKAYILHYGTSSMPGSRFVDKIDDKASPEVYDAMSKVMDNYMNKHGL